MSSNAHIMQYIWWAYNNEIRWEVILNKQIVGVLFYSQLFS